MRKILTAALTALTVCIGASTTAQQVDYGVQVGSGLATIRDDMRTRGPIWGASVGGFMHLAFAESESILAESFFVRTGLNINRRGSNFRVVFDKDNTLSVREGYYHAYYAQLPVLVGVHMELPIRQAGHVVGVFLGPEVSVGLFGQFNDRRVSPGVSSYLANYDTDAEVLRGQRAVFKHLNRFDVGLLAGLSYEYKDFVVTLYLDHGFIATSKETDVLREIERNTTGRDINVEIPNGTNTAWMLSVGYKLGAFKLW